MLHLLPFALSVAREASEVETQTLRLRAFGATLRANGFVFPPSITCAKTMSVEVLQVTATAKAIELIETLRAQHGPLLFHQSGGCCDGSSPMCYPQNDFIVGDLDVLLGEIAGAPFYISPSQFEYWKHTQLTIDVVEGRGGMFSLENGTGSRFLVRSRLFEDAEFEALRAAGRTGQA